MTEMQLELTLRLMRHQRAEQGLPPDEITDPVTLDRIAALLFDPEPQLMTQRKRKAA